MIASRRGRPRIKFEAASPEQADQLLRSPETIRWAADAYDNPRWSNARSTSTGQDRRTVASAFPNRTSVGDWAKTAQELLEMPYQDLERGLAALPLLTRRIPKKKAWHPSYDPNDTRDIYVPCILRRVLSNAVADVLARVTSGRLSEAAVAYIPGNKDPVLTAVEDIARATGRGAVFYVRIDIRDCFNRVPWKPLRRALLRLGLPRAFVNKVMAMQRVDEVTRSGRRSSRKEGVPAGLPESGTLLNILMKDLHEELLGFEGVVIRMYADDLVIIGFSKRQVRNALALYISRVRDLGMDLKEAPRVHGVKLRDQVRTLVKNLHNETLVMLGIEIDHTGCLHMPATVKTAKYLQIRYMTEKAEDFDSIVAGGSRWASGATGTGPGLEVYDQDDIAELIEATYRYWVRINAADAEEFRQRAIVEAGCFGAQLRQGPHRKLYMAGLGHVTVRTSLPGDQEGSGPFDHRYLSYPFGDLVDVIRRSLGSSGENGGAGGSFHSSFYTDDGVDDSTGVIPRASGSSDGACDLDLSDEEDAFHEVFSSEDICRLIGDRFVPTASRTNESEDLADAEPGGALVPLEGVPPGYPAKTLVVHLEHQRLNDGAIHVEAHRFVDDLHGQSWLGPYREIHPEGEVAPALVSTMTTVLGFVSTKEASQVVVCGPGWIPKLFLRADRATRAVGMTLLVEQLHEVASSVRGTVTMAGPVRSPSRNPSSPSRMGRTSTLRSQARHTSDPHRQGQRH
jgi:hypothetical protein